MVGLLAACHPSDPALGEYIGDEVTHNDFESVRGWGTGNAETLTSDQAHSGRYAVRVDAAHEFGLTYDAKMGDVSVHPLKAIEVEAWVFLPSAQADAVLGIQIWPAGAQANSYHEQLRLLDQVKSFDSWQRVRYIFKIPSGLGSEDRLRLFLWRSTSPEPVYMDDIRVKARE